MRHSTSWEWIPAYGKEPTGGVLQFLQRQGTCSSRSDSVFSGVDIRLDLAQDGLRSVLHRHGVLCGL